jgi:hypothetical protein
VVQEYEERKRHKPYEMHSERTEESIRKRWNYIKQETSKLCAPVDHVVPRPEDATGVMAMISNYHCDGIHIFWHLAYHKPNF